VRHRGVVRARLDDDARLLLGNLPLLQRGVATGHGVLLGRHWQVLHSLHREGLARSDGQVERDDGVTSVRRGLDDRGHGFTGPVRVALPDGLALPEEPGRLFEELVRAALAALSGLLSAAVIHGSSPLASRPKRLTLSLSRCSGVALREPGPGKTKGAQQW